MAELIRVNEHRGQKPPISAVLPTSIARRHGLDLPPLAGKRRGSGEPALHRGKAAVTSRGPAAHDAAHTGFCSEGAVLGRHPRAATDHGEKRARRNPGRHGSWPGSGDGLGHKNRRACWPRICPVEISASHVPCNERCDL